jgi:hypothetical protein
VRRIRCLSAVFGAIVLSVAPRVRAQESSPIAESLFRDARARLGEGKVHEACELFARSDKVQHALGTLLNLAACHTKEGKTATAWAEFQEAAAEATRAGDKQRAAFAQDQAAVLEKNLHHVVVDIADAAPGMKVQLDGVALDRAAWGTDLPLDPGPHTIQATAEGYAPWVKNVDVPPSPGTDHVQVQLQRPTTEAPVPVTTTPPPAPESHHGVDPLLVGGIAALAVGAVGFGVAIGFGADMSSHLSTRDSLCAPGVPCYSQAAFDADHTARVDQGWMFVTGAIGVVGLGAGAVLVVLSATGHKKTEKQRWLGVQPWGSPTGAGLSVAGAW